MVSGVIEGRPAHPLASLIGDASALVDEYGDAPAWTLTPSELTDLLPQLSQLRNRLEGLELRMLREADRLQVGDVVGAANTAGWWANSTRTTKPAAHRQVALAARLDAESEHPTAVALNAGAINVEQATVIVDAVDALPDELVGPSLRRDAERHLVALAEHHDAKDLRVLGRKVLDVLAPEVADEHERRVLEAEEKHAAATATFSMRPDGHGSYVGRFKIPELAAAMLGKHLAALAAPKHRAATGSPDVEPVETPTGRVARPLRLGQAFVEYIETRRGAPKAGGVAATIVVTVPWEDLLGAERAARLDTGGFISASEANRLMCEAGILRAVLDAKSQPIELGRKTRFHTEAQRIALGIKFGGCAEAGCDWPPGMCHAHHGIPWSQGGGTNVKDGMLLCPRHHTLAHDRRYQMKADSSGRVTFSRRT